MELHLSGLCSPGPHQADTFYAYLIADQKGLPRDKVQSWTPYAGGASLNVASSIGKLGMDVVFISALGKDEWGDQLQDLIQSEFRQLRHWYVCVREMLDQVFGCLVDCKETDSARSTTRRAWPPHHHFPFKALWCKARCAGDREFAGFGLPSDRYCDCYLDASLLPVDDIKSAAIMVTGTLALAQPKTRETIEKAVQLAHEGGCKVRGLSTCKFRWCPCGVSEHTSSSARTRKHTHTARTRAHAHTRVQTHTHTYTHVDPQVLVDVNWRPVFWDDHAEAKRVISDYLQKADLLKVSDADLEWLLDMDLKTALLNPCKVRARHAKEHRSIRNESMGVTRFTRIRPSVKKCATASLPWESQGCCTAVPEAVLMLWVCVLQVAEAFPKAQGVLVTAGEEGAAYCFRSAAKGESSGFIPCYNVKVEETTGAGDAFTAGFIYKLLQAGSLDALAADATKLKEAVAFGSAADMSKYRQKRQACMAISDMMNLHTTVTTTTCAGALTCTRKGAIDGQPSLDEVLELYDSAQKQWFIWLAFSRESSLKHMALRSSVGMSKSSLAKGRSSALPIPLPKP
eukprot:1152493-Pelagomonas_calceolata.AAC.9